MWLVDSKKSYAKLVFMIDRVMTTGIAIAISVSALCLITFNFANYPWLFEAVLYVYPPFIITSMAYSRIILLFSDFKPWQIVIYKLALILSAGSYIAVGMYFIFDPSKSNNFIPPEMGNSFRSIVILYSFAGFDYHIETLSLVDELDGTTNLRTNYTLNCKQSSMEFFLYGA